MLKKIDVLLIIAYYCCFTACGIYSFTGASIDPNVKTVSVATFPNLASTVAPTLSQTLTEKFKDKLLSETRLQLKESAGDADFSGAITDYTVTSAAESANDQAALSRLTIEVKVTYVNHINPAVSWKKPVVFRQFDDFDRSLNLSDVEQDLIDAITDRIVNDIFNKAFSNW